MRVAAGPSGAGSNTDAEAAIPSEVLPGNKHFNSCFL
jgi:hypothetical protein